MKVCYYNHANVGDKLNEVLIKKITNEDITFIRWDNLNIEHYFCIGSMLEYANENSIIWGTGFISEYGKTVGKPKMICGVRGKLSKMLLNNRGYDCPEIYGDPSILISNYYFPKIEKKYKIGVIPHYMHIGNEWVNDYKDALIINVTANYKNVINNILSCEEIISSSLHGLILADTYGVKSTWKRTGDLLGGNFKFYDYLESREYVDRDKLMGVCPFVS